MPIKVVEAPTKVVEVQTKVAEVPIKVGNVPKHTPGIQKRGAVRTVEVTKKHTVGGPVGEGGRYQTMCGQTEEFGSRVEEERGMHYKASAENTLSRDQTRQPQFDYDSEEGCGW